MNINYMKRGALLFGAAAFASSSLMAAETWNDVTSKYMKNPAYIAGWAGGLTAVDFGVGETWNGAFELHQVLNDMPAGEYTLTVNAFYRCGSNDHAKEDMKDGKNHNAYIFINDEKTPVEGLFDKHEDVAPNSLEEANNAFAAGEYLNTVKVNHPGGDLVIGICNPGGEIDEWTAFDNFKLVGPDGDVTDKIVNADFSKGLNATENWDNANINGDVKNPDTNRWGGVYRKANASPYNNGTLVTLPAGKYRYSVQSFLRYGAGNEAGWWYNIKGEPGVTEGESAYDRHVAGTEDDHAYIFVTNGYYEDEDGEGNAYIGKPVEDGDWDNDDAWYVEKPVMCLFDIDLDTYPDNEPTLEAIDNGSDWWGESGNERQAAAFFVNNPDKYRNVIEFELPEETSVWVGMKKDKNAPELWWQPWRDYKIEVLAEEGGEDGPDDAVEVIGSENAPVEYYTIQGVRVNNPTKGIFVVKQGKNIKKQVIK